MGQKASIVAKEVLAPVLSGQQDIDLSDKLMNAAKVGLGQNGELKTKLMAILGASMVDGKLDTKKLVSNVATKAVVAGFENENIAQVVKSKAIPASYAALGSFTGQNEHFKQIDTNTLLYIAFARFIAMTRVSNPGTIEKAINYFTSAEINNAQLYDFIKGAPEIPIKFIKVDEDETLGAAAAKAAKENKIFDRTDPKQVADAIKDTVGTLDTFNSAFGVINALPMVDLPKHDDCTHGPFFFANALDVRNTAIDLFGGSVPFHEVWWNNWENVHTTADVAWEGIGACKYNFSIFFYRVW
jgi:hypothetical protein